MFKVVSMYTPNTPYEEQAETLVNSMKEFNIDYKIYEIENTGKWVKNCQKNSEILMQAMMQYRDHDIVYVDCDAQFMQYPKLFDDLECDIAYHEINYPDRVQLCSGTLFVKQGMIAWELIMKWDELNKTNELFDDDNLQTILQTYDIGDRYILPEQYCSININRIQKGIDPVIKHWQRSRQYKDVINGRD